MGQLERGLNRLYGVEQDRPALQKYGRAFGLTLTAGLLLAVAFLAVGFGPPIGRALGSEGAETLWSWLRWPTAVLAMSAAVALLFRWCPRRRQPAGPGWPSAPRSRSCSGSWSPWRWGWCSGSAPRSVTPTARWPGSWPCCCGRCCPPWPSCSAGGTRPARGGAGGPTAHPQTGAGCGLGRVPARPSAGMAGVSTVDHGSRIDAGDEPGEDLARVRRRLEGVIGVPATEGNRIDVLRNGDEIFPALLEAIDGAEHTIDFLTFVYWEGEIGTELAAHLCPGQGRRPGPRAARRSRRPDASTAP